MNFGVFRNLGLEIPFRETQNACSFSLFCFSDKLARLKFEDYGFLLGNDKEIFEAAVRFVSQLSMSKEKALSLRTRFLKGTLSITREQQR